MVMDRRQFLAASGTLMTAVLPTEVWDGPVATETLYNGIRLPSPWPPKLIEIPADPVTPLYLKSQPAIIPIDIGRQLFVDDFLIEHTDLRRTFHAPREHAANPLVRPDKPWEGSGAGAMAMVFSDGVWHDPKDGFYKMWYLVGGGAGTAYAVSKDGLRWEKPTLDVRVGTNIVLPEPRDSATVWLDLAEKDPSRRYKLFRSHSESGRFGLSVYFSADGIHWGERVLRTGSCGDRTTAFWNPFRKVWVYSLRQGWGQPRQRRYWEVRDLLAGPQWDRIDEPALWCGSDRLDPQRDDLRTVCQLYNLDCVAYESVLLGMFTIWRGDKNIPAGRPKPNEVCVGFSRDGFQWHRPERKPFLAVSEREGDWNWGNVQSAGGCCLVKGDELYFYHSGRAGSPRDGDRRAVGGATGLAVLRRDGFTSLDADQNGGTLTTRLVRFQGKRLFVNAAVASGELTAEVLDEHGRIVEGLARAGCVPVRADRSLQPVAWKTGELAAVAGKPVKFRFHVRGGQLYAFWVSAAKSGASNGYVAAGGPGFSGPVDNR
jgi:hypothetical protein